MDQMDLWMRQLEVCNKRVPLPLSLYKEIKRNISDAIVHDFNLILTEFDYFKSLPCGLQNEIVESLFGEFKSKFKHFFLQTEVGF